MSLFHPSRKALAAWLAGDDDERTSAHVESCERCASRLEAMEEPVASPVEHDLRAALEATLAPEPGLPGRLEEGINARLAGREAWTLAAELLGLGWRTARYLAEDDEP